jgi:hypothetical protein
MEKYLMSDIRLAWLILPIILGLLLVPISYGHAADFNTVGDVGCKSAAVSNLKNLAGKTISFFGAGDYSYKCKISQINTLWININSKKGVQGNHECEKSGQDSLNAGTVFGNGGCKKGYFATIRGGDTGIIGLNPYASFKKGSAQYNFVVSATNSYSNNTKINWIIYFIHPLFWPVGCSGSHCHGVDKAAFNKIYEPIIRNSGKGLVVQAHTHLTAMGTPKGIPSAICGGGGEDATKTGNLNGYSYVTNKPGYCLIHTELGKATATLIGINNLAIHKHTWNKK